MAEWSGWEGAVGSLQRYPDQALTHYEHYHLNKRELLAAAAVGCAAIYGAVFLFYQSAAVSFLASIFGLLAPRFRRTALRQRRKERLKLQFKEALFSLTSSLAAGRSIENAFRSTLEDLKLLYTDPRTDILQEFQIICYRLDNAESLEQALRNMAERAQIDEMTQFVDALAACKRSGGDLVEVMKRTSMIISEKLGIEQEIRVMIAQKKFEARIMMAVPFVFLSFLNVMASDYMAPLYSGFGYVLLTASLGLLLGCFWLMNRIMSIRM